jgi:O-antigen/teichoic acid export membrane protein
MITHRFPNSPDNSLKSQTTYTLSLTQRAFLNTLSAFLDHGSRVLVALVVTPILVGGLGSTIFGIWQILNRSISYAGVADGRPSQTLKWVIANYQGSNDYEAKRQAVGSALGVWLVLMPLLLGIGAVLVWFSPAIAKVPQELSSLVRVTSSVLVLNLALGVLIGVPEAVLRGMNLGYKRMGMVAGLNILGGGLTVTVTHLGCGLLGVALAQVTVTVSAGILFWHLVRSYVPWFGIERASLEEIRRFFRLSISYAAWDVVNKLLLSSDVVLLGLLISTSIVTDYVLTSYAANTLIIGIVSMVLGAVAPGLGGLIREKKYAKVIKLRKEMLCMSSLFAGVLGTMVLLWNRSFVTLWVGHEHYAGMWVNLLLILIAVQLIFVRNETYLIDLTLSVRRKVIMGLIAAMTSSSFAVILVHFSGIIGLCFGILLGRSILSVTYPAITGAFLGSSVSEQLRSLLRPVLVMGMLFAVSAYIGEMKLAQDWARLIVYTGVSAPLVLVVMFWAGYSTQQRKLLTRRITNLITLG